MKKIAVIAPHPDDETLGCGGALLRHKSDGDQIYWIIVTTMTEGSGYSPQRMAARDREIRAVSQAYGFDGVFRLDFPSAGLTTATMGMLVQALGKALADIGPDWVYLPHPGDIHTDHQIVNQAGMACCKWFRNKAVKMILVYETLSETHMADLSGKGFQPSFFVDISAFLEKKLAIMETYESEVAPFPFPRSPEALKALARFRGSLAGTDAAEAFYLAKGLY